MRPPGEFVLHGGDTAFANRQKLLFDKLSDAEQECHKNKTAADDMAVDDPNNSQVFWGGRRQRYETKRFRGKESIFKRPEGPAPRAASRSIPDYHRNPHKWKKYSLDDVSNEDMTEQSNKRAALSFLKELRARRSLEQIKSEEKMDVTEEGSNQVIFKSKKMKAVAKVEFKKPENVKEITTEPVIVDHDTKAIFRSSKIIMPEYVIGQKRLKKGKKTKPAEKVDRLKQLKLDHLEELDEEQE